MPGSSHPIIARISIGLPEVVKLTTLTKDQKSVITSLLYEMSLDMIEADKRASSLASAIQMVENDLAAQQKNQNTQAYMPLMPKSVPLLNYAQDFLNYSRRAQRKLAKIMGIIFKKGWRDPVFSTILDVLKKELPVDTSLLKILELYNPWCETLRSLRNTDEHIEPELSFLTNYTLRFESDDPYLERPRFNGGIPVHEFLQASLKYLLPFCEEIVLFSLLEKFPDKLEIIEIPEQDRNLQCPKRFKVVPTGMN